MKKLLLISLGIIPFVTNAQITPKTNAIASGDTIHCVAGNMNKTSLAYHPGRDMYYSNNAGGTMPNEYFDGAGVSLGFTTTSDWRGLWFNPNNQEIEGNAWGDAMIMDTLSDIGELGYPLGIGFAASMPYNQCTGAYNHDDDEVIYYYADSLYAISRVDGSSLPTRELTGVSDLSTVVVWSVIYTGIPNNEIGLYDRTNKGLYLYDKVTAAHTSTVHLPTSAPNLPTSYNISYTDDTFWLFSSNYNWIGYHIFDNPASVEENQENFNVTVFPNPTNGLITLKTDESLSSIEIFNLTGQKVTQFSNTQSIDISNLPSGIYTASIQTKSGKTALKKLVKEY